jgi:hypothetical protein
MKTKTKLMVAVLAGILSVPAIADVPTGVFKGTIKSACSYPKGSTQSFDSQMYLHQVKSGSETVTYGLIARAEPSGLMAALFRVEEIDKDVLAMTQIVQRADGILTQNNSGKPMYLANILSGKSKTQIKLKYAFEGSCQESGELSLTESDPVTSLPGTLDAAGKNSQGQFKAGTYFGTLNLGDASTDAENNYQVSESLPGIYSLRKRVFQYDNPNKYVTERLISALALVRNRDGKREVLLMAVPTYDNSYRETTLMSQQ